LLGWRRLGLRGTVIYSSLTVILLTPWLMRNWLRCGNPFYLFSFGIFPVNPVYAALVTKFKAVFGVENFGASEWKKLLGLLLQEAGLPLIIGMVMALRQVRRCWWLSLSIALSTALWMLSIGYTIGGLVYSMRVLSPALVLISVMAAINLADLSRNSLRGQWLISAVVALFTIYGAFCGAVFPTLPSEISSLTSLREILATRYVNPLADSRLIRQLPAVFPAGAKILADDPYAHSLLVNNGSKYTLVPIWSPEVQFLSDPRMSVAEQRRKLMKLGITGAIYDFIPGSKEVTLEVFPFYKNDSPNWVVVSEGDDTRQFARF
jgi:hypothetical protein